MNAKRITVLGAGNLGQIIAADLSLRGYSVNLHEMPEFEENIESIKESGSIEITGAKEGVARIDKVTTDIAEAIRDVTLIICPVRQVAHETLAELCAPHLEDGQTVLLWPGCAGSLIFAKVLKEKGTKKDVTIAEVEQSSISGRRTSPTQVKVHGYSRSIAIAAFPAKDNKIALDALEGVYDATPRTNVLETALNLSNIIAHPPLLLMNLGAVEQLGTEYNLDRGGKTPSVDRVWQAVDKEKLALCRALGLPERPRPPGVGMYKPGEKREKPEPIWGPYREEYFSRQCRYFTEDVPCGLVLFASLGDMLGVPTPLTKCLIRIISVINQVDYFKEGRTVEKLGISGLTVEELNKFLAEGTV